MNSSWDPEERVTLFWVGAGPADPHTSEGGTHGSERRPWHLCLLLAVPEDRQLLMTFWKLFLNTWLETICKMKK